MAKFRVTAPSGESYEITAPDDATPGQIKAYMSQSFSRPTKPDNSIQSKNKGLLAKLKNSPVGGFARGLRDPIDAGAQFLEAGLSAAGVDTGAINKKVGLPSADEAYRQSEQDYQQNWRQGQDVGIDGGRIAGNIAAALPVGGAAAGGKIAATLPGMVRQGAVVGGVTGMMSPVDTTKDDVLTRKVEQGVTGAALGAVAPVLLNAVAKMVAPIAQKMGGNADDIAASVSTDIQAQLAQRGVDFNKIGDQAKSAMLADVQKALQTGGKLDYDALARKADFDKLGIRPTLGQLTQNPAQVQFERNSMGIAGVGDDLAQRAGEQNRQLISQLPKTVQETITNGDMVKKALQRVDTANLGKSQGLYDKALKSGGTNIPLNGKTIASHVYAELDKNLLRESLPGGIASYLDKIAKQGITTVGDAQSKIHAINAGMSKIPDRSDRAAAIVKDKLRQHMQNAGLKSGTETGKLFRQADAAYRQRMKLHDAVPAVKQAVADAAPDDFIKRNVISGTARARDVMRLRAQLRSDPAAWNAVKAEIGNHLRAAATNNKADEFAKFSASGFDRALRNIGDPKLRVIFTREEIATLKTLSRVANAISNQPSGAVVNNSGTSQAVANLAMRVTNIPYLRELVQPLKNMIESGKVASAVNPGGEALANKAVKIASKANPPAISNTAALRSSVVAYPLIEGADR